ncbi:aldose epimerase [Kaistia algarum]|uniref:aldose 1-epimerase family protein n=1 Tax=Kaistia algarum TaxID=2083279 RepID=UPI000CE7F1B0|nr:aldose 1-epimerase family protein [Kaistia algarum]MCX5513064.1 aldose 1-epimerase family protein [Kaistia algarum]PPE81458.1 aldose epimerase [Kaistia algarum]
MTTITLSNGTLSAEIATLGAELQSLKDSAGREWLWQADPAFWPRHAPVLFPIVGKAAGGKVRVGDKEYPIGQHGFARDSEFEIVEQTPSSVALRLIESTATRQHYPFDFELVMHYALEGTTLHQTATIRNPGGDSLPASFGYHPGFAWPLPDTEAAQTDHIVLFEKDEPAEIRRLGPGGVEAKGRPSPVAGRCLALDPSLFDDDAMIFDRLESRSLWFGVPGKPGLRADFPDMPYLGLWMKPGAPYLCIEPWQGHAAPEGFAGDIGDMPGMMHIAPGASEARHMSVTLEAPE